MTVEDWIVIEGFSSALEALLFEQLAGDMFAVALSGRGTRQWNSLSHAFAQSKVEVGQAVEEVRNGGRLGPELQKDRGVRDRFAYYTQTLRLRGSRSTG